jgi:hypothetical protein
MDMNQSNQQSSIIGLFSDLVNLNPQNNILGLQANRPNQGIAPYGIRYREDLSTPTSIKGKGYMGEIPNSQGMPMTELSSAFNFNGKTVQYPLIVPTLSQEELQLLQSGGNPTEDIYNKAETWAKSRLEKGLSPFATPQDVRFPIPASAPTYIDPFGNTIGESIR